MRCSTVGLLSLLRARQCQLGMRPCGQVHVQACFWERASAICRLEEVNKPMHLFTTVCVELEAHAAQMRTSFVAKLSPARGVVPPLAVVSAECGTITEEPAIT